MSGDVTAVSLFSGIEGLGLGLHRAGLYDRTVAFCEYEDAPSRVLAHHYPHVPNLGDITQVDWTDIGQRVDVLHGGFPCQDISKAGKGAGIKKGTRSGLWFEFVRAIRDLRPGLVVVENVSALLGRGLDIVLGDLAEEGFDAEWEVLRASDIGAPHRRERVFIIATSTDVDRLRHLHRQARQQPAEARLHAFRDAPAGRDAALANGHVTRLEGHRRPVERAGELTPPARGEATWGEFWPAIQRWERIMGRPAPEPLTNGEFSADYDEWHMGFPAGWTSMLGRSDRIKACGNAVVPQVAEYVGRWALDITRTAEVAA